MMVTYLLLTRDEESVKQHVALGRPRSLHDCLFPETQQTFRFRSWGVVNFGWTVTSSDQRDRKVGWRIS